MGRTPTRCLGELRRGQISTDANKIFIPDGAASIPPMPARYLQLPTICMQFIREHFAQLTSRWIPLCEDWRFYGEDGIDNPEQMLTAVDIRRIGDYHGDRHHQNRMVLIRRGAVAVTATGIGGGLRQGVKSPPGQGQIYAKVYAGSVVCFCFSRIEGEAEMLAGEVEQLLNHYSNTIRRDLMLQRFLVSQVGEVGQIRQFPGFFAVPVVVDYIYEDNVERASTGFPIRNIRISVG